MNVFSCHGLSFIEHLKLKIKKVKALNLKFSDRAYIYIYTFSLKLGMLVVFKAYFSGILNYYSCFLIGDIKEKKSFDRMGNERRRSKEELKGQFLYIVLLAHASPSC